MAKENRASRYYEDLYKISPTLRIVVLPLTPMGMDAIETEAMGRGSYATKREEQDICELPLVPGAGSHRGEMIVGSGLETKLPR